MIKLHSNQEIRVNKELMIDFNQPEIKCAMDAVRQAASMVQQIQNETLATSLTKDDSSPVTIADFASQALVAACLLKYFPNDPLVAEEDASALCDPQKREILEKVTRYVAEFIPKADPKRVCAWIDFGKAEPENRFWTLDPLDGTKGFLRNDQYAVALALIVNGRVQLGVLGCPKLNNAHLTEIGASGSLLIAVRGQGTWLTELCDPRKFNRLRVSGRDRLEQARLLRSFERGHTNVDQIQAFSKQLNNTIEPIGMDSQAKYALLASGHGDLLLRLLSPSKPDYREKIWDQSTGSLLVEEAGGQITDLDGKPLDFSTGRLLLNNRGILASNHLLHSAALEILRTLHV